MNKILFVNACVRDESRTERLARAVLEKRLGEVTEVNLAQAGILPLDKESLRQRDAYLREGAVDVPMLAYARQFAEADEIVIAAPYWDLSFPSTLKIYFEAVSVCGVSFGYTEEGRPKGLCRAQRIIYVTTAGGPIAGFNMGYDYVKALADKLYGIQETLCCGAESLDIAGADVEKILQNAIAAVRADERI